MLLEKAVSAAKGTPAERDYEEQSVFSLTQERSTIAS